MKRNPLSLYDLSERLRLRGWQVPAFTLGGEATDIVKAGDFQRTVGDHLVHVHVRRGAGTALHHIDRELIGQFAGLNF